MFTIVDVDHLAGGDGFPGAATRAHVNAPTGLAAAKDGTLFFADNVNNQVFALSPAGLLSVVAGTGACGHAGDGGPAAAAQLCAPLDVALDETHGRRTLYVVDGPVIRALDLTAAPPSINLFAGGGSAPGPGYGDGSAASFAALNSPQHVSVDPSGSFVYIVDNGSGRFRRVDLSNGNINAWLSVPPNVICTSSNCSAFQHDCALGFDAMGTPYVSWTPYFSNGCNGGSSSGGGTVFRVAPDLSTTPIAGGGSNGGEGVPATNALLSPVISQLFFDPGGSLYLLERSNHRVRKLSDLTAAATIKTVIVTGASGNGADFAAPTATALSSPWAIEVLASGAMVVSDTNNAALRAIWPPYP